MRWTCVPLLLVALPVPAATFQVGPTRPHTNLNALFAAVNLEGGDIVEVDGGVTYPGGVIVPAADGGSPGNPVVIRGIRVGGERPKIAGAGNTLEFRGSDHVVLEGFDVTGGTSRCILQGGHDVTVRDSVIHGCPGHGILGTDLGSGSFTLEYSEIYNAGNGTNLHPLYMQSDEVAHPGSVFRMRFCYVHNGTGGNLLKSRHERSEIYYNWFEGATYHELELIGPDEDTQDPAWTRDLVREDADVVGNVIVHTNTAFGAVIRAGGDGSGRSKGRVRFVNNTIVLGNGVSATVFRLFDELQSVEMHNNVIETSGGSARIIRAIDSGAEPELVWTNGRHIHGSNNWVRNGSTFIPVGPEWSGTLTGAAAAFVNAAAFDYTPAPGSALSNAGNAAPQSAAGFEFPTPLPLPSFVPKRAAVAPGAEVSRPSSGPIDIGAVEGVSDFIFGDGFEP